jgi:hypothetical protein
MKRALLVAALALVYAALGLPSASAIVGCCCDPITFNGTFIESAECAQKNYTFIGPPPDLTVTCSDYCNATLAPQIIVTPPGVVDCASPLFKAPPTVLSIRPINGEKALTISFSLPCAAYSVNVSRCAGVDCADFVPVAQIAPTTVFTDRDQNLQWNTLYRYQLVANYVVSGTSDPVMVSGNAGDLECWHQGDAQFCVSSFYYELFASYLKLFGYAGTPANSFRQDFAGAVNATFAGRINKGWYCDSLNRLYQNPTTLVKCRQDQVCVADERGAQCVTPSRCGMGGLFGLYGAAAACEALPYCFFDRSRTSIDSCFTCNPRMSCADYRTRGSCERDRCSAGQCAWRDVLPDLGIGVCVDTRFSNCQWCRQNGTPGLENNGAYNEVFDQCTEQKSNALAVNGHLCVYNKNAQEGNSCDSAACMDYTLAACGSPEDGIALNPDNSLAITSTDTCNFKVCQVMAGVSCVKNADGNAAPDCNPLASDRRECELDHFVPNTSLVPVANVLGRIDWLRVQMFDRLNGTHEGTFLQGKPGYRVRVCIVSPTSPCSTAASFAETNLSSLNFNDLSLQAGKSVLATMAAGTNTLRYYGIDRSNNPEIVKEMQVIACDHCQGPKVLEVAVRPSRLVNNQYFTIADIPIITVSFNEPATITTALLLSGTTALPLTITPVAGSDSDYTFIPLNPLPDGEYTFTFNAKDNNGLLMDAAGSVAIIVDTTPGSVTILPSDGVVLNESAAVISFIFTEPLSVLNAALEQEVWLNKYAVHKEIIDLAALPLQSSDNITYTATVTGLLGGKKNIHVQAEDLAGNPTIGKSSFWVNTGSLQQRLRAPSWGVSSTFTFDIFVETTRIAECKYFYDTPTPPPTERFADFVPFAQTTGVTHTIPGFDRIKAGDFSAHKLHVYCKTDTALSVESYDLRVDTTPPSIKSAYAEPAVIIERREPDKDIFTTTLKVQTDEDGFCKYSTESVPFVLMTGLFPGFDEIHKQSHAAEVDVTQDKMSYTYYISCSNLAGLPSPTVPVTFSVDTSIPFAAASKTPAFANTTNLSIRVETNKRAFCYLGDTLETVLTCMGECNYGLSHVQSVSVNSSGSFTWYVKCSTGASAEVSTLEIPVIVDVTPPEMLYVNDSSNLIEEPEFSYFPDRLQISFLGMDAETAVNAYHYRLLSFFSNETVLNWTLSTNTNGTAFYVTGLTLTEGNKYRFEVYPVNAVGLHGAPVASDGVTIDFSKRLSYCSNGAKESVETDIDCGGPCPGCLNGALCAANVDCASGFCKSGTCATIACDDAAKNGNETDVDCGGNSCLSCGMNMACVQGSDCASGSCVGGKCSEADACVDGVLSGSETDIDCGGSCPTKCGESKNCRLTDDCSVGLACLESTCQAQRPGLLPAMNITTPPPAAPPSLLGFVLKLFLILLILAALSAGGYLAYQYYVEQRAPVLPPVTRPPAVPARKPRPWPQVIEKLRSIARKEEPVIMDRDWVSLGELAERLEKGKVRVRPTAFGKLQDLVSGKTQPREAAGVLAAIRKEPEAFALLRRISFEQLTPAERSAMRKQVALLKAGRLTAAEIEDLLAKLRVTAAYYRTHKKKLERELAELFDERSEASYADRSQRKSKEKR